MNLLFLLLVALPICVAQFRIQGASDGNNAAESLSVDDAGHVEYSRHKAPSTGGFSIQGASDGHSNIQGASNDNSNFNIQGPSDGHSNFNIQGASDGHSNFNIQGASDGHPNFNIQPASAGDSHRYLHPAVPAPPAFSIQGATDGHSQIQGATGGHSRIQGSYDGPGSSKSLQYDDPSGYRVNWRSYDRQVRPPSQPEAQYTEVQASVPRAPQRQRARARPQQHAQPQPQPQPRPRPRPQPQPQPQSYEPFENAPPEIKQILQYQKMLPYINIIPEPFRYENILGEQQQQPQAQYQADDQPRHIPEPRRPSSRGKARIPSRQKRQAQRRPPAEQQPHYSPNHPPAITQILKYQQQTPYINGIPEQYRFNVDAAVRDQADAVRAHLRELANAAPLQRYGPKSRQRRQAQYSHRQQQPQQPPAEPQPQYSTNLPGHVKDLLKLQAQIPYTIFPNLVGVRGPEKPYVPQPVQSPTPSPVPASLPAARPQYQSLANAYQGQPQYQGQPNVPYQGQAQAANAYQNQIGSYQNQAGAYQNQAGAYQNEESAYQGQPNVYKNQADAYQPQQSAYNQVYQSELKYPQYSQGQPGQGGVRPVTENQY